LHTELRARWEKIEAMDGAVRYGGDGRRVSGFIRGWRIRRLRGLLRVRDGCGMKIY